MRDGFYIQFDEGEQASEQRIAADRWLNELARLVGVATALEDIAKLSKEREER